MMKGGGRDNRLQAAPTSMRGGKHQHQHHATVTASDVINAAPSKPAGGGGGSGSGSGDSNARVRVVVRIRPLSPKEEKANHKNILEGGDHTIVAWDPTCLEQNARQDLAILDASCWSREFAFDRCLWSTDINSEAYASQSDVYDEVGQPVLDWILNGYNCCVLAFGQTGAGKTWTMMGDIKSPDPSRYGLVPRICFSLFEALDHISNGDGLESVMFSHMEIYNENVRDLLAPPNVNPSNGMAVTEYLRVREHPTRGVFVANLTTIRVTNFEDLMSLIAIGDKNRTVGATNANAHSSRSHAIVTLTVIQRSRSAPKNGLPTSALQQRVGRVHLVDLAGSERVYMTGAQGTRLREASNINRSLSVLGDVIKCLGDRGQHGGTRKAHVPYRNSTLTMVLKDSLGGNAHAVMLTAVSPSSFDYEETISTLKYADRAKRVRMRVEANVTSGLLATDSSAVELVPLLQAEVRKLREMLAAQMQAQEAQQASRLGPRGHGTVPGDGPGPHGHGHGPGPSEEVEEMRERVRELETQLAERERLIESLDMMRREREVERELQEAERALDEAVAMREQRLRDRPGRPPAARGGATAGAGGGDDGERERSMYYHIEERSVWEEDGGAADGHGAPPPPPPPPRGGSNSSSSQYAHQLLRGVQVSPLSADSAAPSFSSGVDYLRKSILTAPGHGTYTEPAAAARRTAHLNISPTRSANQSAAASASASASAHPPARSLPVVVLSDDAVDVTLPRVINLNQDPLFSECLVYYVPEGTVAVGSKEADADIVLSGPDIMPRHCVMRHDGDSGHVVLHAEPEALVFVNGDVLAAGAAGRRLTHHDRVAFGRFHLFRFEASGQGSGSTARSSSGSSGTANADKSKGKHGASRHSVRWEDEVGAGGGSNTVPTKRDEKAGSTSSDPSTGPGSLSTADAPARQPPDWEYAQQELMLKNEAIILRRSADQPLSALLAAAGAATAATAAAAAAAAADPPPPSSSPPSSSSSPVRGARGSATGRSPTSSPQGATKHISPTKEPLVSPEVNPFATQPQTSAANAGLNPFADVNLPPLTAAGESHLDVAEWQSARRESLLAAAAAAAPRGSSGGVGVAKGAPYGKAGVVGGAGASGGNGNDASPSSVASSSLASVASASSGGRIMLARPKAPPAPPQGGQQQHHQARPATATAAAATATAMADDAAAAANHWAAIGRATQRRVSNNPFDSPIPADAPVPPLRTTPAPGGEQVADRAGWEVVVETSSAAATATAPPPKPSAEPAMPRGATHTQHLSPVKSPVKSPHGAAAGAVGAGRSPMRVAANGDAPASFEKEAALLSEELALMQQQLQERMKRYQVLTSFQFPPS